MSHATAADGSRIFSDGFVGDAFGTAAIGAMIAPIFVGMLADRFFATERLMAVLHFAGAALLFYLTTIREPALFYVVALAYFLTLIPAVALSNSLALHHLPDRTREYPLVRVWGTIAWVDRWSARRHVGDRSHLEADDYRSRRPARGGFVLLRAASHSACPKARKQCRRRCTRPQRGDALQGSLVHHLHDWLVPHLHPDAVLLHVLESVPQRARRGERGRQANHWPTYRNRLHAAHAGPISAPRRQMDARACDGRLGPAIFSLRAR